MTRTRSVLALLCFLAVVASRTEPRVLSLPFIDREPIERAFASFADNAAPDYPRFLAEVRQRTRPGDTVAIVFPNAHWDDGYSYAYYRASYFLTGREVLPIVAPHDLTLPQNFERAQFVASWRTTVPRAGRHVIWAGHGGVLLSR
jgi:hypothetical protein